MSQRLIQPICALFTAAGFLFTAAGCTFVSKAADYSGLPGQHGKPVEYYSATNVGVNLVFVLPILGEPTVPATLGALTAKVKEDGGTNVRVVQSGSTYLWYILLPFSIFIHPVVTSVTADAEFSGPSGVERATAQPTPAASRTGGATPERRRD